MTRDVALTIAARLGRVVLGLATSLVSARFLGPAGRGEYFYVVTLAALVVQFGNLGLHASNTYYVARNKTLLSALLANSTWVSVVVGAGGGILVAVVLHFALGVPTSQVVFVPLLAGASLFYLLGTNLLVGMNRIGLYNAFELTSNLLVVLLLVVATVAGATVAGFLSASTAAWILASGMLAIVLGRLARRRRAFDREVFAAGLRYAAKAYLVALLGFLVLRANVFLLERFSGSAELGFYSIAAQFGDVLAILPTSVAIVLFPSLMRDGARSWRRTTRTAVAVGAMSAVAAAGTAMVAVPLVQLLFGRDFGPASAVLLALLPGTIALAVITVFSQYLATLAFPRELIVSWAAVVLLLLALEVALIPMFGGVGAAVALSIAYVVLLVLVVLVTYRHRAASRGGHSEAELPSSAHAVLQ